MILALRFYFDKSFKKISKILIYKMLSFIVYLKDATKMYSHYGNFAGVLKKFVRDKKINTKWRDDGEMR